MVAKRTEFFRLLKVERVARAAEVARAAGITPEYFQMIRRGTPCSRTVAVALAAVLRMPLPSLFDDEPAGGRQEA